MMTLKIIGNTIHLSRRSKSDKSSYRSLITEQRVGHERNQRVCATFKRGVARNFQGGNFQKILYRKIPGGYF